MKAATGPTHIARVALRIEAASLATTMEEHARIALPFIDGEGLARAHPIVPVRPAMRKVVRGGVAIAVGVDHDAVAEQLDGGEPKAELLKAERAVAGRHGTEVELLQAARIRREGACVGCIEEAAVRRMEEVAHPVVCPPSCAVDCVGNSGTVALDDRANIDG